MFWQQGTPRSKERPARMIAAAWRHRHRHAVEFSDRHSDLEDRPGALLRQHRRLQTGRSGAGLFLGDRRYPAPRRPAEGRAEPRHGQELRPWSGDAASIFLSTTPGTNVQQPFLEVTLEAWEESWNGSGATDLG